MKNNQKTDILTNTDTLDLISYHFILYPESMKSSLTKATWRRIPAVRCN